jgi:Zn-dependent protease
MLHEIGHAYAASLRGDDTAKLMGRITLNPIPHLDLFGSLIFPAILLIIKAPILFAWAKPVPINPLNFKNPKIDIPLVSFAGPFVHILLIIVSMLIIMFAAVFSDLTFNLSNEIISFFYIMIKINVVLFVFNMLPIPPLDGSKIIACILPRDIAVKYVNINQYAGFVILILFVSSGFFGRILNFCFSFINYILSQILF